jgi:anti-sigma regulatory factor (Ser/Thr protein kinase)
MAVPRLTAPVTGTFRVRTRDSAVPVARRQECRTFEPTLQAPAASRAFVREVLAIWDADDLADTAELLTTELVTNVVRHAVGGIGVDLEWDDATLRVEVRDGSSILPAVRELPGAHGGYGLRLVAGLVRDWGVSASADGKAVWFTLDRESAQLPGS